MIIMLQVIEHIKKPYDFFINIRKLLNKKGVIFITTPNLTGITAIMKGKKWCGLSSEGHFLLYTQKSLDFLMRNCGFLKLKSYTDLIPIVYEDRYPFLRWFNRICVWMKLGGGIKALYEKSPMIN